MRDLIREIHRRSLWQVLGIYLAGSWVALQVVEQLAEAANLPAWVRPAALALLVIGFPIVMATAFVQEGLSTRAPTLDRQAAPETSAAPAPGGVARWLTWRNAILGGVGAFAAWGVAAAVMMLLGVGPGATGRGTADDGERVAIAVLPFSSLGDDEQSQVFSLGIHDDLLTRLSKIASLRVTSRTSVMGYRDAPKPIPVIAEELGVDYVLEGSVLGAGGQVNINAQLIDGASDEHLWAETYNRALSVTNVFAIQKELAQRITQSLSATLLPDEVAEIERPPTENMEAYNAFLRGHTYFHEGPRSDDFEAAIDMYQRAVDLDPTFAEAHARLSFALGLEYEVQRIGDPETLARARAAAERAYELDPDLPEAALAFGQYYYAGERNLDLAMEHLTRAGQENFHSADVFHLLGAVQRRKGDLEGSIASWEEMVRIDPLSAHYYDDLASVYAYAGRWEEAEEATRRWQELDPRSAAPVAARAWNWLERGELDAAEAVIDSLPDEEFWFLRSEIARLRRDFDAAIGHMRIQYVRAVLRDQAGKPGARATADSILPDVEERLAEEADQPTPHRDAALLYAILGRREDAIREADRAIELLPVSSDFLDGPNGLWTKVEVLARLGDVDGAIEALETLIANKPPGSYTTGYLRLEPALDPLRGDSRFDDLLDENMIARGDPRDRAVLP